MTTHRGRTALYRAYTSDGILLYIGISANPETRMKQHDASSEWHARMSRYTVDWFGSRAAAVSAEATAVQSERPLYNRNLRVRAPESAKAIPYIPSTYTPPRQIRIDDRWYEFEYAAKDAGATRAQLINAFIAWYLGHPGAELPVRPGDWSE